MREHNKGFSEIIIILVVTIVVAMIGFLAYQNNQMENITLNDSNPDSPSNESPSDMIIFTTPANGWKKINNSESHYIFRYPDNLHGIENHTEIKNYLGNSYVFFLNELGAVSSSSCLDSQTTERVELKKEQVSKYEFQSFSSCVDGAVLFVTYGESREVKPLTDNGLLRVYKDDNDRVWQIYEALMDSNYTPVYGSLAISDSHKVSIVTRKDFRNERDPRLVRGEKLENIISSKHQELVNLLLSTFEFTN